MRAAHAVRTLEPLDARRAAALLHDVHQLVRQRKTRLAKGRSDFDAISGAADDDQRRVDIVMPGRPAGAEVPIAGTPTPVAPVGPESLGTFGVRRFFGSACDRLLARSAWFQG
jgi:hypothetical protein